MNVSAEFVLGAMLTVIGSLIGAFVWLARAYLHGAFSRNDAEHAEINATVAGVGRRVDHIIKHHDAMPAYTEGAEKS